MFKIGAYGLIVIGIVHLLIVGADAALYAPGWLAGGLWSVEHWLPISQQSSEMARSGLAFWSTLGSCAVPLVTLGALLVWLDRRGQPIPRFPAWLLLIWGLSLAALMPPSGYPLVAGSALAMMIGRPTGGWV